jgi:hypothetical protein
LPVHFSREYTMRPVLERNRAPSQPVLLFRPAREG